MTSDLSDFGAGDPYRAPLLERKRVFYSPTKPDKPAGFACWDKRNRERVYASRRTPYHYYENGEGYAVSLSILREVARIPVERVIIHEKHTGDVYVFGLADYMIGPDVPAKDLMNADDPQRYTALENAIYEFPGHADKLYQRDFYDAMKQVRGGWD